MSCYLVSVVGFCGGAPPPRALAPLLVFLIPCSRPHGTIIEREVNKSPPLRAAPTSQTKMCLDSEFTTTLGRPHAARGVLEAIALAQPCSIEAIHKQGASRFSCFRQEFCAAPWLYISPMLRLGQTNLLYPPHVRHGDFPRVENLAGAPTFRVLLAVTMPHAREVVRTIGCPGPAIALRWLTSNGKHKLLLLAGTMPKRGSYT